MLFISMCCNFALQLKLMQKNRSLLFILISASCLNAQTTEELNAKRITLPNQWCLTPVGKSLTLGDLPLNLVISPNKKYMAVTNNGQSTQSIQLVDVKKQAVLDTREIAKSWLGLVFSDNSKSLYASGGNDNRIIRYDI